MFKRVASRLRLALVALASLEPALAAQDAPPRIVSLDEALLAADRLPDLKAAEAALRARGGGNPLRLPLARSVGGLRDEVHHRERVIHDHGPSPVAGAWFASRGRKG